jgi:hypothetical protein
MTKILDTADVNHAHACGRIDADDLNSIHRIQAFREFGGLTIVQGDRTTEVEDDDVPPVLTGATPLGLSPEERAALKFAYWAAVEREGMAARTAAQASFHNAIWLEAAE